MSSSWKRLLLRKVIIPFISYVLVAIREVTTAVHNLSDAEVLFLFAPRVCWCTRKVLGGHLTLASFQQDLRKKTTSNQVMQISSRVPSIWCLSTWTTTWLVSQIALGCASPFLKSRYFCVLLSSWDWTICILWLVSWFKRDAVLTRFVFNAVLHETTSHRASLLPREPSAAQGYQGWDVAPCFQHIRMLRFNRNRVLVFHCRCCFRATYSRCFDLNMLS